MDLLKWKKEYGVGVKEIDNQHKELINATLELYDYFKKGLDIDCESKLKIIQTFLIEHFETEEKYFKKFNYPETKIHIEEHQRLNKEIKGFIKKNKKVGDVVTVQLVDFLIRLLVNHFQNMDQKYKECFLSHGLK